MDMQKCNVCGKRFDFDKEGLECSEIVVCSDECAKKSASSRGNAYAIHDKTDNIIDTNADGSETVHNY